MNQAFSLKGDRRLRLAVSLVEESLRQAWLLVYDPRKLAAQLRNRPRVLSPFATLLAIVAFVALFTVDLEAAREVQALRARGMQYSGLIAVGSVKLLIWLGKFLLIVNPLFIAALGWSMTKLWGSATVGFRTVLSLMLYGEIVCAVGSLLALPFILIAGQPEFTFSAAVLVPADGPVHLVLSRLHLFQVTEIIAVGVGMAALSGCSTRRGIVMSLLSVGFVTVLIIASVML